MDLWDWLSVTGAVCGGIVAVVSFYRYAKTKNKGHLFLGCCFLLVAEKSAVQLLRAFSG